MALHSILANRALEKAINSIPEKKFTTLQVIDELIKLYPEDIDKIKSYSQRNWRSVIGKAIKRFSIETEEIIQISSPNKSPAIWEKKARNEKKEFHTNSIKQKNTKINFQRNIFLNIIAILVIFLMVYLMTKIVIIIIGLVFAVILVLLILKEFI